MDQYQTMLIGLGVVVGLSVVLLVVMNLIRDIMTHNKYTKLAVDHVWAEFAPTQGLAWSAIVQLIDQKTGEFDYEGRRFFVGKEHYPALYPPGRGKLAQVPMTKCIVNPASLDMATCLHNKPTVSANLVGAAMNQRDTKAAMDRSADESDGGKKVNKVTMWMFIAIGVVGLVGLVGVIFSIKGASTNDDILKAIQAQQPVLEQIAQGFGAK